MEAAESKSPEINSNNEEVIVFSDSDSANDEDQTDLSQVKVKEFLASCAFTPLPPSPITPTFSKTDKDKRPESPGEMIVSGSEEPADEDGEADMSMSEQSQSQSLNTSSADTVLVSQNSQPSLVLEVEEMEEEEMGGGDTQIIDQSDQSDCRSDKSLARDQNSNDAEKKKSITKEFKNSGANYWLNEMLKSRSKPKKLDIEDPSFPFTSSFSQRMKTNMNQNSVETLDEFLGGISLSDKIVKTGLRHPAKHTRGKGWVKLKKKNTNLFMEKLLGGVQEVGEPATSSSKTGKRSRSSSPEELPGPSTTPTTSPVTSRSRRKKNREDSAKKTNKQPAGTCPLCYKSMRLSVLQEHAGEALTG